MSDRISTFLSGLIFLILISGAASGDEQPGYLQTSFQTSIGWMEELNIPADVAIVYSHEADRLDSWREAGYETWMMTGASWLSKNAPIVTENPGIVQFSRTGAPFEMIAGRAWVIPTEPWIEHIKGISTKAIKNGARAILPEEPEFFASNGYGQAFKQAWRDYYGETWTPPHDSVEGQWKSNQLKSHLFTEFYRQVFSHVKQIDPGVKCIIPVHSNLNYADWRIVAPHYSFSSIPDTDGFIAQVWTGTAKHAHMVGGQPVSDTFAYAFLEYGYFSGLAQNADLDIWFLTDPVEDAKGASWDDLRSWYEDTLTAALMYPGVNRYECTPWPNRVFRSDGLYGNAPIPQEYAAELFTIWSAQDRLPRDDIYPEGVTTEIGVLTSDTLMWQRDHGQERFMGFVAPMIEAVRKGIYLRLLPAERLTEENFPPEDIEMLLAGFDAWKPAHKAEVDALADWVLNGGTLLYLGGGDDYDEMPGAWWREGDHENPALAMIDRLGLDAGKSKVFRPGKAADFNYTISTGLRRLSLSPAMRAAAGDIEHVMAPLPLTALTIDGAEVLMAYGKAPVVWGIECGRGYLLFAGVPGEFVSLREEGPKLFMELLRYAMGKGKSSIPVEPDAFVLRRGPFVVARGMSADRTLKGAFIDIFRPESDIIFDPVISPGENAFMLDVNDPTAEITSMPGILHSSGRIRNFSSGDGAVEFDICGPTDRFGYVWLRPRDGKISSPDGYDSYSDPETGVVRVKMSLSPQCEKVRLNTE